MDLMRTLARPLLASPFIVDGLSAVTHPHSHVERTRDLTEACEPILGRLGVKLGERQLIKATRTMGMVSIAAGTGLALGIAPRPCAAILCVLSVPVTLVNASSSVKHGQSGDFARRIAMTGAMAIASADRAGVPSTAWRFNAWRNQHRAQIEQATQALQANV